MHIAIGTAAATLLTATVSVAVIGGGREPRKPDLGVLVAPEPTQSGGVEQETPPTLDAGEPARAELAFPAIELPLQREQHEKSREKSTDENVWQTEVFQATALAPTVESIAVNSGAGDVEVLASATGRLEIQAKVRAQLGKVAQNELTRIFEDHVAVTEEKGVLKIEDAHKNTRGWSVDFVVSVPGRLPVSANSGAGDITVRTGHNHVSANTGAGDVLVELALERLHTLSANSGAGDIVVEVASIEAKLGANSGAGDVTLRVAEASSPGAASLNSGAGDIRLVVPGNIVGTFDLETSGQSIEVPRSLGLQVRKDVGGRQTVQGTVGSGGGNYILRSGAGELSIELGNALLPR